MLCKQLLMHSYYNFVDKYSMIHLIHMMLYYMLNSINLLHLNCMIYNFLHIAGMNNHSLKYSQRNILYIDH